MRHKGPIITLAAGLVLAAILMVLNIMTTRTDQVPAAAADTVDQATSPASPSINISPSVTATTPSVSAGAVQPPAVGSQATFAGTTADGAVSLAIAVKDGKAVAYLCDGKSAEAWLQGSATGGALSLIGAGTATLTGTFGNGVATASVSAVGRQFSFSLKVVAPPSGLYRASANVRGAQLVGGWIVLDNGQQVGLATLGGETKAVPPLDTTTKSATVDGTAVTARAVDGAGL